MKLRQIQEEMRRLVAFGEADRPSPLWGKENPDRLRVYRNNVAGNWKDTLNHDFRMTKAQFRKEDWDDLQRRYFTKHPPGHWELNASMAPFPKFLAQHKVKIYIPELADFEWHDLKIFMDRAPVRAASGVTNPTAVMRPYKHQIFYWVEAGAPSERPPEAKPEVLVFYRDSQNTSHILEADPLMILLMEHFRKSRARLEDLEPVRQRMLPQNQVPLESALENLRQRELILL